MPKLELCVVCNKVLKVSACYKMIHIQNQTAPVWSGPDNYYPWSGVHFGLCVKELYKYSDKGFPLQYYVAATINVCLYLYL